MAPEPQTINVGTRRSALAIKQTELVVEALKAAQPQHNYEIRVITTLGDKDTTTPLPNLGKGLWTSELEAKLVSREFDILVHSLKDMPTTLPDGCILGGVTAREDPRDVVVFRDGSNYKKLSDLPAGSVVGTSSLRRAAQLKRSYPGLAFDDVRGNLDTRLRKLNAEDGPFACIILAAAGLLRLDYGARIAQYLESSTEGGGLLHAVGQGALGLEVRDGDEEVLKLVESVQDTPTMLACSAERTVMRTLEGGCSIPIGVETTWVGEGDSKKLRLKATVVSLDGTEAVDGEMTEPVSTREEADSFGYRMAQELIEKGARKILDAVNEIRAATA